MQNLVFGTQAWLDAVKVAINASPTYREAARHWEGDFWFIVEPDRDPSQTAQPTQPIWCYLDLWHGECRVAQHAQDEHAHTPEFRISGSLRNWRRVLQREVDPIRALMTHSLKLKGNVAKIMRNVRAAQELVLCVASVPTNFEVDMVG